MQSLPKDILQGYRIFREKYALGDNTVMSYLADRGQKPKVMVISCCDSRVDPALILQCHPGDLFVVRNIANIVPPYQKDEALHGTSAALEFGIRFLEIRHLILLGHSQCGGIEALLNSQCSLLPQNDFITKWVSIIKVQKDHRINIDDCVKLGLTQSYENCLSFPWIAKKLLQRDLTIYRWFFDIKMGEIFTYSDCSKSYQPLYA